MSLVCAVPSFADLTAVTGQDVIVIGSGCAATRLRLDDVLPLRHGGKVFFRALLSGDEGSSVSSGTHLSRVGNHLVRLRLDQVEGDDGREHYEAHAQAHLDEVDHVRYPALVAV
jgi:hypothetical protein